MRPDVGTVRDEGNDAHLPCAYGAQQREHMVAQVRRRQKH